MLDDGYDDGDNVSLAVIGRVLLDKSTNCVPLDDYRTRLPLDHGGN